MYHTAQQHTPYIWYTRTQPKLRTQFPSASLLCCYRPFVNPRPLLFSFFSLPSLALILISFRVMASCGFTLRITFSIPPRTRPGCAKCSADHAGWSLSNAMICCSSRLIRVTNDAGGRGEYETLKCDSMLWIRSSSNGAVGM